VELDPKRRETILPRIQQLIHEKGVFAPIWGVAGLSGGGPRVGEPGIGVLPGYAFSAPYEGVKLKAREPRPPRGCPRATGWASRPSRSDRGPRAGCPKDRESTAPGP